MKQIIKLISIVAFAFMSVGLAKAQNADKIVGTYQFVSDVTKQATKVKINKVGNSYAAEIIWLEVPNNPDGSPKVDEKNPNEKLRSRKVLGIKILKDLKYDSKDNNWSGGTIYDPQTGKTYKVVCNFESAKKLKVRGYIGIPTLGRTLYWTKID